MSENQSRTDESEVAGHIFVRCPGCTSILLLGRGWRGRDPPLCPDCDVDDADDWDDDPRVTMQTFLALVDE
ncbi:MAG: hypothetical protein ACOCSP_00050 [archaeon]